MEEAISPDLRRKLAIIEAETEFFSQAPPKPTLSKVYIGFSVLALAILLFTAIRSGDFGAFLGLGLFVAVYVLFYFYAKQQHEMYSNACELIRYYKATNETET